MLFPDRFSPFSPVAEDLTDSGPSVTGRELTRALLKAVDPGNIRLLPNRLEIALGSDWPRMLTDLVILGSCLEVTRNSCAVLGRTGGPHRLSFSPDLLTAQSCCGCVSMDFRFWHSAWVVAEDRENSVAHFVEFRDLTGTSLHRICLTNDSRADVLVDWTTLHQAAPVPQPPALSLPSRNRWSVIQQRHSLDYDQVDEVAPEALMDLWTHAQAASLSLCCLVGNEGMIQTAELTPQNILPSQGWTFVSNDTVGLHFDPAAMSSIVLHHLPAHPSHPALTALKCFDDHGSLCLAITPTGFVSESWDDFIQKTTR